MQSSSFERAPILQSSIAPNNSGANRERSPSLGSTYDLSDSDESDGRASREEQIAFSDPDQVLVFLDFDDTLFPTTEIFDRWGLPSDPEKWAPSMLAPLSDARRQAINAWGDILVRYLSVACSHSDRVVILTNAGEGWVRDCIEVFAPQAMPLFEEVCWGPRVVYAPTVYAKSTGSFNPVRPVRGASADNFLERAELYTLQKEVAMLQEARKFYGQRAWANILSIGDMPYERDALQNVSFRRVGPADENLRTKTFTVAPGRSLAALSWNLELGLLLLPVMVRHDGNLDVGPVAHGGRMPPLATIAEDNSFSWPPMPTMTPGMTLLARDRAARAALRKCERMARHGSSDTGAQLQNA